MPAPDQGIWRTEDGISVTNAPSSVPTSSGNETGINYAAVSSCVEALNDERKNIAFYLEDLTSTYDAMSSGEEWIGTDAEAAAEILHSKIQRVQQMEQHLNSICVLLNQQYEAYKEAEEYRRKQF